MNMWVHSISLELNFYGIGNEQTSKIPLSEFSDIIVEEPWDWLWPESLKGSLSKHLVGAEECLDNVSSLL